MGLRSAFFLEQTNEIASASHGAGRLLDGAQERGGNGHGASHRGYWKSGAGLDRGKYSLHRGGEEFTVYMVRRDASDHGDFQVRVAYMDALGRPASAQIHIVVESVTVNHQMGM
jgi:hypothetical protein